jgi:hypothetical protein
VIILIAIDLNIRVFLQGLWLGIVSGLVTQTLLLLVISFGTNNWEKEVRVVTV